MRETKLFKIILAGLLFAFVAAVYYLWIMSSFPGKISTSKYEPVKEKGYWTFCDGVIYRHPGAVPMLEVSGTHYEIRMQYGVLLRPE
jgi:hypothetical protein